ncbi:patatin-like phospholipase family protein [Marinobacter nauticus]|uniref:patatin-like phospholipase family protein n=1 Tax=Marinobacter nauticus TaxID=2743 RepID=UPI001C993ECC|nr:patatin-like phospholipase family protein [Marinobacter nauticus]MBY5937502.1 patatin-like phospholipase family protein [Marinobacter nauticus]MBY5954255.1 patatin-like phospholipase family protein [Marinobacter nauticus]MBY6008523.1 patatin-like phospholipase family protein [Marinobacter nauticus]
MTAIHSRKPALTIRAGRRALQRLQQKPLGPEDVHVIPGAAGGPKALGISGLDKAIFGDWLPQAPQERALIGSSIGSWRFAAIASSDDPKAQLARLAKLYTSQRFAKGVSAAEISRKSILFLEELLGSREDFLLSHPWYRLSIVVVRSLGLLQHDTRGRLSLGLMRAISANMVSRRHLGRFMERGIVHDARSRAPVSTLVDFPSHEVPLSRDNLLPALLASASIPLVMSGVRNIPGAPEGVYRDGGLLDYHLDLPYQQPGIILYPHFTDRVVPGWFDKTLPWRRGDASRLQDVVLVSPSPDYLATLPDRKLPDRKDFEKYVGDDAGRERAWRRAIAESDRLGDEFLELVESGRLLDRIQPL